MRAQDDVRVEEVKVTITDEGGTFLEEGEAVEGATTLARIPLMTLFPKSQG